MAPPCSLSALLVFSALLGLCLRPGHAYKPQGNCEIETGACSDADQDDTGLIQSPLRKTVEVTKVRGIVGSAAGQEGGAAASSQLPPPRAPGHVAAQFVASQVNRSATPPASAIASTQPDVPADVTAHAVAGIQRAAAVAPAASSGDVHEIRAAVAAAASSGDMHEIRAAVSAKPVESPDDAAHAGLSFFQMDQEKSGDSTTQDSVDKEFQDDFDMLDAAVAEGYPSAGDANSAANKVPASDDPGWAWATIETSGASLRAKLGQVLLLVVAIALIVNAMSRWRASGSRPRDALSAKMRKKLERMPVATGVEVRSFCAIDGGSFDDKLIIPGMLMRIQGRVVNKCTAPLVAPLSGRSCVLYSASVSQSRHDGVHEPPVAFASAARDFTVQLEDCPEMFLEINSQDVFPFDMEAGRYACELPFGDAPDSWRGFMLDHLTPGVEGCGAKGQLMNRVDLGAKGPLNFRECALVVGSRVTCIGEVVREHNGKLRLSPWAPPPPQDAGGEPTKSRSMMWLTPEADPWLHKLMVSDDSRLLVEASQLPLPGKCRSCL